jgi:pimeloyl-ACP methyl ester carboxylesterase
MSLYVETTGSGPPVLFLHGATGSSRTYGWLELEGRTTVRMDFRGHGASGRTPGAYLIQDYVDDALSALGEPAFVVGHSLGGVAAWMAAQRRPELVTGLFLEDPPLFMGEPAEHARNPAIPAFAQTRAAAERWQASRATPEQVAAELAAQTLPTGVTMGSFQTEEAVAARAYALTQLDLEVIDRILDGTLLAGTDTTAPVRVPTFILAADDALGAAFPTAHEARLRKAHPDVEIERLPGASHTIHDQRSTRDAYVRALTSRA